VTSQRKDCLVVNLHLLLNFDGVINNISLFLCLQAWVSVSRLNKFMLTPDIDTELVTHDPFAGWLSFCFDFNILLDVQLLLTDITDDQLLNLYATEK
jgi:hypothetical protein